MSATLYTDVYLVFERSSNYGKLKCRLAAKTPTVKPGEVALKVEVSLPASLFKTPQFTATLTVPDTGTQVSAVQIQNNIAQLVKDQLGITLNIVTDEETEL